MELYATILLMISEDSSSELLDIHGDINQLGLEERVTFDSNRFRGLNSNHSTQHLFAIMDIGQSRLL